MAKYHVFRIMDTDPKMLEGLLDKEIKDNFKLVAFHDDRGYITVITLNEKLNS